MSMDKYKVLIVDDIQVKILDHFSEILDILRDVVNDQGF